MSVDLSKEMAALLSNPLVRGSAPGASAAPQPAAQPGWLAGLMQGNGQENPLLAGGSPAAQAPSPERKPVTYDDAHRQIRAAAGMPPPIKDRYTPFQVGSVSIGEKPANSHYSSDGYEGDNFNHSMSFVRNGDSIDAVIHDIRDKDDKAIDRPLTRIEQHKLKREVRGYHEDQVDEETGNARWASMTPAEQQSELDEQERERRAAASTKAADINSKVDALVASGWRPTVNKSGGWHRPDEIKPFASPQSHAMIQTRLRHHGIDIDELARQARAEDEYDRQWR